MNNIPAKIKGLKYTPLLCRELHLFNFDDLSEALSKEATFVLNVDGKNQAASGVI